MPSQIHNERESQKGGRKGKQEEWCNRETVRMRDRGEKEEGCKQTEDQKKHKHRYSKREYLNMHKT